MPNNELAFKRYRKILSEFVKENKNFNASLKTTTMLDKENLKQQFQHLTDIYEELRQAYEDLME